MSLVKVVWVEKRHTVNASIHCSGSSLLIKQQSPPKRFVLELP